MTSYEKETTIQGRSGTNHSKAGNVRNEQDHRYQPCHELINSRDDKVVVRTHRVLVTGVPVSIHLYVARKYATLLLECVFL